MQKFSSSHAEHNLLLTVHICLLSTGGCFYSTNVCVCTFLSVFCLPVLLSRTNFQPKIDWLIISTLPVARLQMTVVPECMLRPSQTFQHVFRIEVFQQLGSLSNYNLRTRQQRLYYTHHHITILGKLHCWQLVYTTLDAATRCMQFSKYDYSSVFSSVF